MTTRDRKPMLGWPSPRDFPDGLPTKEEFEEFRIRTASKYELEDCRHGFIRISCEKCREAANRC